MPTRRFHKKKRTTRKSRKTRRMMGGKSELKIVSSDYVLSTLLETNHFRDTNFYLMEQGKKKNIGKFLAKRGSKSIFENSKGKKTEVVISKNPIYYKSMISFDSSSMSSPSKSPFKFSVRRSHHLSPTI